MKCFSPSARRSLSARQRERTSERGSPGLRASKLFELAEGKIRRVRVFVDRDDAKAAANAR